MFSHCSSFFLALRAKMLHKYELAVASSNSVLNWGMRRRCSFPLSPEQIFGVSGSGGEGENVASMFCLEVDAVRIQYPV